MGGATSFGQVCQKKKKILIFFQIFINTCRNNIGMLAHFVIIKSIKFQISLSRHQHYLLVLFPFFYFFMDYSKRNKGQLLVGLYCQSYYELNYSRMCYIGDFFLVLLM